MRLNNLLNRSPFFIKLLNWEYWPYYIIHTPVVGYYLWLAFKARSFVFFSASNPSIETGGMLGESKWKIFELIPEYLFPATILVPEGAGMKTILARMKEKAISYPIIAKPDRGERGWKVSKIKNDDELLGYLNSMPVDFLIQSYVSLPVELSVFYFRYPGSKTGTISSVVIKEMLSVTGNGTDTLLELIKAYPRALLQLPVLKRSLGKKINSVPARDEVIELVPFGNHVRGAKFIDGCKMVDEAMTKVFDVISSQVNGFYYGRYDLRCESVETLKQGKGIQILELNGCGAEPAHIYHPGASLFKAYKVLFYHFKVIYEISLANHRKGVPYMTLKEFISMYKLQKEYTLKAGGAK